MRSHLIPFLLVSTLFVVSCDHRNGPVTPEGFIGVSAEDPAYFQFENGDPYIPVGINMVGPGGRFHDPDSALMEMEGWMKNLSENGGNYIRVWLSQSFWDIEDQQSGVYREEKAKRIDRLFALARKYNLRIKITLEHFRSVTTEENPQPWATKWVYHTSHGGPLDSIRQYLTTKAGQDLFLNKLDFYQKRYGSDTIFFGWELWNEMNAMKGPEDSVFFAWNEKMLKETKNRFPENLVMQSLGSFDADRVRPVYNMMMLLPGNEVAQVHRYLDPGAELSICQAPMDIICSSAVEELRSYHTGKPVLLAETGAVESRHSGPSRYYERDTDGMLLHDILFAPFFSGAAGTGMCWHWDYYVAKNNLWFHYKRFSEAIKGINPIEEKFIPEKSETGDFRIYILKGEKDVLVWIRDKSNTWETELENGIPPRLIENASLELKDLRIENAPGRIRVYDPWKDQWQDVKLKQTTIPLPSFKRSLVIRIPIS